MSSGVNEGLDVVAIDLAVDVEHDHGAETLRVVLHCKLHIVFDILIRNFLKEENNHQIKYKIQRS